MAAPEASRNTNSGQFALCIEGLPSSYTWQDVKDLARNRAEHGIRADVAYRTGLNGERTTVHVAKVTRWNEANHLYDWLITTRIEQRRLRVHFFEGAVCIKSNCQVSGVQCPVCRTPQNPAQSTLHNATFSSTPVTTSWAPHAAPIDLNRGYMPQVALAPVTHRGYSQSSSASIAAPITTAASVSYNHQPTITDPLRLQQAENAIRASMRAGQTLNPTQQEFLRRMSALRLDSGNTVPPLYNQTFSTSGGPVLAAAASGAPINTAFGFARTEVRGVFVSGLDFKTKCQDLEDLFSKAGTVRKCQLHTDNRGHGKGTATIEFVTAAEATQAVKALDNFKWRGRTLRVRSDREAVVVAAPAVTPSSSMGRRHAAESELDQEPTIVDGSNSRQNRRDSKISFQ